MKILLVIFICSVGIFSFLGIASAQFAEIPLRNKNTIEKEKLLLPKVSGNTERLLIESVPLGQKKRLEATSWGIEGVITLPGFPVVSPYQDMGYKITNIDTGKRRIISISDNDPFLQAIALAEKEKRNTGHAGPLYMAVSPPLSRNRPAIVQYLEPTELTFGEFFKPGGGFLAPPKLAEGQTRLILNCRIEEVIEQTYNWGYDPTIKQTIPKPTGKFVVSQILKCFDKDGKEVPELMSRPGGALYRFLMKGCDADATECGPFLYDSFKGTLAPYKEPDDTLDKPKKRKTYDTPNT